MASAENARGSSGLPRGPKRTRAKKASGRTPPSPLQGQAHHTGCSGSASFPGRRGRGGSEAGNRGRKMGGWGAIKEQDPAKEGQSGETARLPSASLLSTSSLCYGLSALPLARIPAELPRGCELQRVKGGSPSALIAVALVLRL